jgi:hypothetical protein
LPFLLIVGLCIASAVLYGVVHDQITARICVEYFTIGHPPIFRTSDPTLLGLGWGVLATWSVGLILGLALAIAARFGRMPKRSPASLIRPIAILLVVMGVCAFTAGVVGWILAKYRLVFLVGDLAQDVPADRHVRFLASFWAHSTSYLVGFGGGVVLIIKTWKSRRND